MFCNQCGNEVPESSRFCGACGASLAMEREASSNLTSNVQPFSRSGHEPIPAQPPKFYKNPSVATVLSFFWAGLGQIYNGEIGKGIMFICAAGISALLMFLVIGFFIWPIVWICGMVDANNSAKRINARLASE